MDIKENRTFAILVLCLLLNGVLVVFFILFPGTSTAVQVLVGIVLTLVLWRLILSAARGPVRPASEPPPHRAAERSPSADPALQILSALQREGRLIDFLQEDLTPYEDGQIGAAVRPIHSGCREVLKEHVDIRPIFEESEGSTVTVPAGFDAQAIRLTGNVTGHPPFRGLLRHRGWKAEALRLPGLPEEKKPRVLAPAEVEIE